MSSRNWVSMGLLLGKREREWGERGGLGPHRGNKRRVIVHDKAGGWARQGTTDGALLGHSTFFLLKRGRAAGGLQLGNQKGLRPNAGGIKTP